MRKPGPPVIRRPPPPRHHLSPADKDEGHAEMAGGNIRTRTYYFRRCKGKMLMNMESLPDELLFEILLHLPAQDIYDSAIFVCRKWYRILCTHNFIYSHLRHASYGLLFHSTSHDSIFATVQQGRIEISKLTKFRWPPTPSSCNGLVLDYQEPEPYVLNIVNPLTKQYFVLPPCFREIPYRTCGIAYASASMAYKVVATCSPYKDPKYQPCAILTVGIDKSWRTVCTQHLPFKTQAILARRPLITEGFMHWASYGGDHVLTLDVEIEVIKETPPPVPQVEGRYRIFLSTGRYLSLFIRCREYLWEVWEMNPKRGEWKKLPDITLEAQKCKIVGRFGLKSNEVLVPYGWLKYLEVLVFRVSKQAREFVILYNLVTEEVDSIELPSVHHCFTPVVHKNGLVWLAGC